MTTRRMLATTERVVAFPTATESLPVRNPHQQLETVMSQAKPTDLRIPSITYLGAIH